MHILLLQKVNNITLSCRAKGHTNSTKHSIINADGKLLLCAAAATAAAIRKCIFPSLDLDIARSKRYTKSKRITCLPLENILNPIRVRNAERDGRN